MKKRNYQIDIEIDKLANSIENAHTGDVFDTEVLRMEIKQANQLNKEDWLFNWKQELRYPDKEVYKLTIKNNPNIIQGLISLEDKGDHIFMHLIESAKFNKGKKKIYLGVPGNLVAFACQQSFIKGYDGYVSFVSKTQLIRHYIEILGAKVLYSNTMIIDTVPALKLIQKYFKT